MLIIERNVFSCKLDYGILILTLSVPGYRLSQQLSSALSGRYAPRAHQGNLLTKTIKKDQACLYSNESSLHEESEYVISLLI